ncbi:hypothetical protein IJG72_02460 [bacterium]|nr:hypothetical protein [bacterium]
MESKIQSVNEKHLNTKQLMDIGKGILGVSAEKNESIFVQVKELDTNSNNIIDNHEADVSNLINLGNTLLNKLASILGIEIEQPIEGGEAQTYEDIQADSISKNYFEPYIDDGKEILYSSADLSQIQSIKSSNLKYAFEGIINEKLAQGVKIVSETETEIVFDDGSKISLEQAICMGDDSSKLEYRRVASDGSRLSANMRNSEARGSSINMSMSDGNRAPEELWETLATKYADGSKSYDEKAVEQINQFENHRTMTRQFYCDTSESDNEDEISSSIDVGYCAEDGKYDKGMFKGHIESHSESKKIRKEK